MATSADHHTRVEARALLKARFGYEDFRDGQSDVIEHLLEGHSAAAVFPTGGGKSICYQLPALMLDGLTIVVSPLIALMKDQIDALTARGIRAARLDSTLDAEAWREVMDELRRGELRLLYVAPERFNNERFRQGLTGMRIALFAVDEAHCISEWGHNFRPDYLKLAGYARQCGAERVLALTATATATVLEDICNAFDITDVHATRTGFHRPNLHLKSRSVTASDRDRVLVQTLKESKPGPGIVYVTLQKSSERLASLLSDAGLEARHYHAGMPQEERSAVQDWFVASGEGIVVATIAFGMGIDKSDIRRVIHYNLPKSLENYAQEIGRAGRDGGVSVCELLACRDDLVVLENFVLGDTPTLHAMHRFVAQVFEDEWQLQVSHQSLAIACDIRPLVLSTLLTRLELQGYLNAGTPFYGKYQFKPHQSSAEILSQQSATTGALLKRILRHAVKARLWFDIDIDSVAEIESLAREQIVGALDRLAEAGLLELKVSGVRYPYQILQRPASMEALAIELAADAATREQRELDRLQQTLDWIALDGCQSAALSARFDEIVEGDCGHCSWCEARRPVVLAERASFEIEQTLLLQGITLQQEHQKTLVSLVEVARLLCGLSSPRISRSRLQRLPLFGALDRVPYREVLRGLEAAQG